MHKTLNLMLKIHAYPEAGNPDEKFVDSGVFFFRLRLAFKDELHLHSRRRGGEARKGCLPITITKHCESSVPCIGGAVA